MGLEISTKQTAAMPLHESFVTRRYENLTIRLR
jgi:hypothetical protein